MFERKSWKLRPQLRTLRRVADSCSAAQTSLITPTNRQLFDAMGLSLGYRRRL
jgi:hypothetical protein